MSIHNKKNSVYTQLLYLTNKNISLIAFNNLGWRSLSNLDQKTQKLLKRERERLSLIFCKLKIIYGKTFKCQMINDKLGTETKVNVLLFKQKTLTNQ